MITKSQSDGYVEQLKGALGREDYPEARLAAYQAYALEGSWKIRLALLGLRIAPGVFRILHRFRSLLLNRIMQSRRRALEQQPHSTAHAAKG